VRQRKTALVLVDWTVDLFFRPDTAKVLED
jgi:hypothetical protein